MSPYRPDGLAKRTHQEPLAAVDLESLPRVVFEDLAHERKHLAGSISMIPPIMQGDRARLKISQRGESNSPSYVVMSDGAIRRLAALKRIVGIEPTIQAWKASVLPGYTTPA